MKYQPGDIVQCWGGFALVKAVHEDYLEVNYSAADKPADFRVFLDWIDGHWRPAETYDRTEFLRLLAQARDAISIEATNLDNNPLLSNAHDAIDHCLMHHAEARHSGPTDTEILDWIESRANFIGPGVVALAIGNQHFDTHKSSIREAIKRAMEAEGEREK